MKILFEEKNVNFSKTMKDYAIKKIKENDKTEVKVSFEKVHSGKFIFAIKDKQEKISLEGTDYYALCDVVSDKYNKLNTKKTKASLCKKIRSIKRKEDESLNSEDDFLDEEE